MPHGSRLLLALSLIAVLLVLGGAAAYSYVNKDSVPGFASSGEGSDILDGWSFIVLGRDGVDVQGFQSALRGEGINATVSEYNVNMLNSNPPGAHSVVIVNLIDKSVSSSINSPNTLSTLRDLSMRGVYVLFLTNNTITLKSIAGAFIPPLSVPEASTITITKQYSDNTTETITENLLTIVGRTYKNIDGRMVPEGITITVHYNTPDKLDNAIEKALNDIPSQIMELELNQNNSNGR